MGRPLVSLVAILLCASLLAPAGAVAAGGGFHPQTAGPGGSLAPAATQQQFDHTEFRITVYANGSARWTFQYGKSLANETERQQFREFADSFENGSSPLYDDFRAQAADLAAEGSAETGRNMTATGFRKSATITGLQDDFGVVEMSFAWTAFAVLDDRQVRVGDVFEGGLYLGPGQRLVIETGPGTAFESVEPSPDDTGGPTLADADSVTWRGERRFTDEHPQVVFEVDPATTTATGGTTDGGGAGGSTTTDDSSGTDDTTDAAGGDPGPGATTAEPGGLSTVPWLAITAVAAVVVVGAVVLLQRAGIAFEGEEGGAGGTGPGGPGGPGDPAGADAGGAAGPQVAGEPAIPDEEMLTDEERVLGLLRENGGRMRQVNIVDETGWSKSKVSMLLSEMEDDEQVTKLRVGRENIVSLPGHEPGASDSALE